MANIPAQNIDKQTHDELCCTYAALILYDDGASITGDKLRTLIKASGNSVENHWPTLFAKALEYQNIAALLQGGGGAPVVASGPAQTASADAGANAAATKEPEKAAAKEEEEADVEMGDLFGDDF